MFCHRTARFLSSRSRVLLLTKRTVGPSLAQAQVRLKSTAPMKMELPGTDMYSRQLGEAQQDSGPTVVTPYSKTDKAMGLQNALMHVIELVSGWCVAARYVGVAPEELDSVNAWTLRATAATLPTIHLSNEKVANLIREGIFVEKELAIQIAACSCPLKAGAGPTESTIDLSDMSTKELEAFGTALGVVRRHRAKEHPNALYLDQLVMDGLKGVCEFVLRCHQLQHIRDPVMALIHEVFHKLEEEPEANCLHNLLMQIGQLSAQVLAMLDEAHVTKFGVPEPTSVRITPVEGKCILVSGHDMQDLLDILKQTEGKDINVYTHGGLLAAHAYPVFKGFPHLVGNYDSPLQSRHNDFIDFPGSIIMTSTRIKQPRKALNNRIYTMDEAGIEGIEHIASDSNFSSVITQAASMKGFPSPTEQPKFLKVGYHHQVVTRTLANDIAESLKSGKLSSIFWIGGSGESQWDRAYFAALAEATPDDSLILTMGLAKNSLIESPKLLEAMIMDKFPRMIDLGQSHDVYSGIVIIENLAKQLGCDVSELPLNIVFSHAEQKDTATLLALLSKGYKNIFLGPGRPDYVTFDALKVLSDRYNLKQTGDPKEDVKAMMQGK